MGFKCPFCSTDFGTDKKQWETHVAVEHDGIGKLAVEAWKDAVK